MCVGSAHVHVCVGPHVSACLRSEVDMVPKLSHWIWNLLMEVDQKVGKSQDPSVPAHPVLRSQVTAVCLTWVLQIRLKSWRLCGKRRAAWAISSAPFCSSHMSDAVSFLRGPHRIKSWSPCGIRSFVILSSCLSTLCPPVSPPPGNKLEFPDHRILFQSSALLLSLLLGHHPSSSWTTLIHNQVLCLKRLHTIMRQAQAKAQERNAYHALSFLSHTRRDSVLWREGWNIAIKVVLS